MHMGWVDSAKAMCFHCVLISASCIPDHALFFFNDSVIVDTVTVACVVLQGEIVRC